MATTMHNRIPTIRSRLVLLALACVVLTSLVAVGFSFWMATIGNPGQSLRTEQWNVIGWLIAATVVLLAGGLGLAWVMGGRIARSLQALVEPAHALGFAEKVTIPPLHLKEADDIGGALVEASTMLSLAQHEAQHDVLTGLASRMLFNEFVSQQLALSRRNDETFAILYIGLDGFRSVNDEHGRSIGDEVLRAVGARLKAGIRESDIAARLGGDEFAAVLIYAGMDGAATAAGKLVKSLALPYPIGSLNIEISVSIGVAGYPDSATTTEELLHRADEAMYNAKAMGKRRYALAM